MDALQDPSFLLPVVEIIAGSRREPSIHDLLDAYATFVNRVRSHSQFLEACDTLPPALVPLNTHRDDFVRALRRDIRLAHSDPFSTLLHPRSSLDENNVYLNVKIDSKQYARDSSSLCHHALCVVTTVFRFPAFYLAFSEHDLSLLLGDVLDIALADRLPVLNAAKTYSLSLWALGCHRLPVTILGPRRDDVFSALQRSLDSTRQPGDIVLDGLKAISHAVECHPSAFLDLLSPLLSHVTANLNSKSSEHRLHASVALGKFANALIHQSERSLTKWQSLSGHIASFLEPYYDESQSAASDTTFSRMVRNAFSVEMHARRADDPAWILAVLASLIILCGPALYGKPAALQLILRSLAVALTHKRSIVRALHPHVWRCFVWTFGQMLLDSEGVEPVLISSAFYVIKQEVSGGIGVALAGALLSDQTRSDEHSDRVSRVLSVLKAMVRTECKHTRREGFMFLQALVNDAQARHQISRSMYEIPASVLLDGTVIRAEWDSLPSIINSIPKVPVFVHWPEEAEIARHCKTLMVIWKQFTDKVDRKSLDSDLVDVWLSILLACAHQLSCGQHISAVREILNHTAAVIVGFLPSLAAEDCEPDWGSWNIDDQLWRLALIDQLWSAMRKAFVGFNLAEVAELVLASILKYAFHVLDDDVQTMWGNLCASLMTIAPPSFLRDTHDPSTSQLVIRSQRELWGVVATSLSSSDRSLDWKEVVQFLAIPTCCWVLSDPELTAWEALFRNAIAVSEDSTMAIAHMISRYFQGKEIETWDSIMPVLGFFLAYTHEHSNSPTDELLSLVDVCLTVSYNRARHSSETLSCSLKLLHVIRHLMASTPDSVMPILQALRGSLCLWIEDHAEVMSDDQFNSVAVSLYCETLKALELLPLSTQSLLNTEDFLASGFSRIPAPALAPFAFEKFWRATYHGQIQFCGDLPQRIKSCLFGFVAAYGGDLADGVSLTTESQSQSTSNHSQAHIRITQHQDASEFDPWISSSSMALSAQARPEIIESHEREHMFDGQDGTTFLLPLPGDDAPQPTALRQLQESTCRTDASFLDGSERSINSPQSLLSPILPSSRATPGSQSSKEAYSVASHAQIQRRRLSVGDDASQKRSRTSRNTLRTARRLESEPATRDITPVDVPRMNSVPLNKRRVVFDGVEVPTFCAVSRRKMVQRAKRRDNTVTWDSASIPKTPSRHARGKVKTPQSSLSPSDGADLDWEDFYVDGTSSEVDVDRSLANAYPSSSPLSQASAPHDSGVLPAGSSLQRAMSQNETSSPPRPSLRRAKTTSARLDALRDIYSSVENGASQIPLPELVQATTLVHRIGAVLSEQMKKKLERMDDPR